MTTTRLYFQTPPVLSNRIMPCMSMMHQVEGSIVDADLILLVTDIYEEYDERM
jgi:GTP-binding protein Era